MKHTIIYQDVDGYQIVSAFAAPVVDPMQTWRKIENQILALPELAQLNSCKDKIAAQMNIANSNYALMLDAGKAGNTALVSTYEKKMNQAKANAEVFAEELKVLSDAYNAAKMALFEANEVYSQTSPGEQVITDEVYEQTKLIFDELGDHEQLTISGQIIPDFRGVKYWKKADRWEEKEIAVLGVAIPSGGIIAENLTEAQRAEISEQVEADRIDNLSTEEKAAELARVLESLAAQAVQKESIARVKGETFDAPAWYQVMKTAAEQKYS